MEVVRTQVRLIEELLVERFGRQRGFAASDVVTLDPAAGTGTYLLAVIEHALAGVEAKQGASAVPGQASAHVPAGAYLLGGLKAIGGIRVTADEEAAGLDVSEMGMEGLFGRQRRARVMDAPDAVITSFPPHTSGKERVHHVTADVSSRLTPAPVSARHNGRPAGVVARFQETRDGKDQNPPRGLEYGNPLGA